MKIRYKIGLIDVDNNAVKILKIYKYIFAFLIVGWTTLISFFLFWKIDDLKEKYLELLLNEARIFSEKDTLLTECSYFYYNTYDTLKLKYKSQINDFHKEKLIQRQIKSEPTKHGNIIVRFISANPINPNNKPDKCESQALIRFQEGENGFYSLDKINNQEYYRYVIPIKIKKDCISCHKEQNYKIGDIKGAYSISISTSKYNQLHKDQLYYDTVIHLIIWSIGILVFSLMFFKLFSYVKEFKLSRDQFYEILNNMPVTVFIKESEGNLIYMNKIAEESLPEEFRNGKWQGLKDSDIWPAEIVNKLRENDLEVLIKMQPKVFEEIIMSGDKKTVWLTHKFPLKDNSSGKIYIVGLEIDITERKQKEEEIKRYSKQLEEMIKSKDKFISILAHDLRGPFTPILGYTELLATSAEYLTPQEIKEYANSLDIIVKNQFQLLENILDWSRLENNRFNVEPKQLNLYDEVKKIVNLYLPKINDKEIKLIEKIDPAYEIVTDQHSLNTILRNLISNAIKYTPRKGTIQIIASKENNGYKIQVVDTGVGISEENLSKIFDGDTVFTTRGTENEKGTGLGLSLCKEIVEKLGGRIWVENQLGKGSTFSFFLPNMEIVVKD